MSIKSWKRECYPIPAHAHGSVHFSDISTLTLGAPLEGGIFAGITTTKEGQHCAVVLLPEAPDKRLPWKDAMKWAEGRGATLPARPVAAMLFANLKASFEPEWHWTCEQLDRSCAWVQTFGDGFQLSTLKSYEGRARAVRLIQLDA